MPSRDQIQNQVMLLLDRQPCHGYEIRRLLNPLVGEIEMTRLYRILKTMKNDGLIDVSKTKGPYGPERRIYRVGPRGERYLRGVLK